MTQLIQQLELANKTCNILRNAGASYEFLLGGVPCRYESLSPTSTSSSLGQAAKEKATQLAAQAMFNKFDLRVSDRVEVIEDSKTFVVCSIQSYDEVEITHNEVLLREVASYLHEEVQLLKLGGEQQNFDPVFKMWQGSKEYITETHKVLIDRVRPGMFPDLQAAGRLTGAEYLLTFDLPVTLSVKDKVRIYEEEYHIQRIENMPYQKMVVATKVLPDGKQF